MKKIRVGILCGGESGEHEVSLQSARNIVEALDREKYEVVIIGIRKDGRWTLSDRSRFLQHADDPRRIQLEDSAVKAALLPGRPGNGLVRLESDLPAEPLDAVFPVLHGPIRARL